MAVKKKNLKKKMKNSLLDVAVRIKCCYCNDNETCNYKVRKEKDELRGCMTYCTITPNVTKKTIKKKKRTEVN